MPSLRFSRDRRGYESTYLLHSSKRRPGAEQARLLYWFRTPPHVKIGRAAFDEEAIRLLEEQHPDVEFDWDRILTTKPPAAPEVRDPRDARPARRPERRPGRDVRREPARPEAPEVLEKSEAPREAAPREAAAPVNEEVAALAAPPAPDVPPQFEPTSPTAAQAVADTSDRAAPSARRFVRVFDAPVEAVSVPEHHASEPSVAERMLGAERLTVLRARHAEILARISARGGDPARLEALREQAAAVDPDAWVTEGDVTAGLATVDATLNELHRIVGRRRRRRRRRREGDPRPGTPTVAGEGEVEGDLTETVDIEAVEAVEGADDADDEAD